MVETELITTLTQSGMAIAGFILTVGTVKAIRVYPVLKRCYIFLKALEESKKDGKITQQEKIQNWDNLVYTVKESWSLITGFFPNKTKVK